MNRKLLSAAVAATITAPAVVLADAALYGKAHASIDWFNIIRQRRAQRLDPEQGRDR